MTPSDQARWVDRFRELHRPGDPLLIPNPWDIGSARLLASLGFQALATTSSGFAATLGRLDGSVTRDEAIAHAGAIVAATDLPVSADLENGFEDDPAGVAETARLAVESGLAGFSVEDWSPRREAIYDRRRPPSGSPPRSRRPSGTGAPRRHRPRREPPPRPGRPRRHDRPPAGLPGGRRRRAVRARDRRARRTSRAIVSSVDRPVNVLARAGAPAGRRAGRSSGVSRISVGGAFAFAVVAGARCRRRGSCASRAPTRSPRPPAPARARHARPSLNRRSRAARAGSPSPARSAGIRDSTWAR